MAGVRGMKWGVRKPAKPLRIPTLSPTQRARLGGATKRAYSIWATMNSRCHNPNSTSYKYYGGRGIHVCDAWRRGRPDGMGFWNFYQCVGNPPPKLSLDREDVNGNYVPGNVRWATSKEQSANERPYYPYVPQYGSRTGPYLLSGDPPLSR